MQTLRPAVERGYFDHGWLKTFHSFSFAEYHDPQHVHFGNLRVLNEDVIAPQSGFPAHPHRDMEIITYVLAGGLGHQDSLGSRAEIPHGEIQRMTAGSGIVHSEFNARNEVCHLLQIWLLPNGKNLSPGYSQHKLDRAAMAGHLSLLAAAPGWEQAIGMEGQEGVVVAVMDLHADAALYAAVLDGADCLQLRLQDDVAGHGCCHYLHLARGEIKANGLAMQAGDALKLVGEKKLELKEAREAELLLFALRR